MAWVGESLFKNMLDSTACYVLDCESFIFVWAGTYSTMSERSWAMLKAEVMSAMKQHCSVHLLLLL